MEASVFSVSLGLGRCDYQTHHHAPVTGSLVPRPHPLRHAQAGHKTTQILGNFLMYNASFCRSSFPVQSPHVLPNWSGGHLPRCVVLKVISYRPSSTSPRVSTMALDHWTRRLHTSLLCSSRMATPFLHSQGTSPPPSKLFKQKQCWLESNSFYPLC